jgi:hypothetical protein
MFNLIQLADEIDQTAARIGPLPPESAALVADVREMIDARIADAEAMRRDEARPIVRAYLRRELTVTQLTVALMVLVAETEELFDVDLQIDQPESRWSMDSEC